LEYLSQSEQYGGLGITGMSPFAADFIMVQEKIEGGKSIDERRSSGF